MTDRRDPATVTIDDLTTRMTNVEKTVGMLADKVTAVEDSTARTRGEIAVNTGISQEALQSSKENAVAIAQTNATLDIVTNDTAAIRAATKGIRGLYGFAVEVLRIAVPSLTVYFMLKNGHPL